MYDTLPSHLPALTREDAGVIRLPKGYADHCPHGEQPLAGSLLRDARVNPEELSVARFNPPAPVISDFILRLTVESLCQGQTCETVLDYRSTVVPPPTVGDMNAFLATWLGQNIALYLACLSPRSAVTKVTAADISSGITPTQTDITGNGPGTAGVNNLPLEMSARVTKGSSLKGAHGRGAIQMPAVPDAFTTPAVDPNTLNAAGLAAYLAFTTSLLLGISVVVPVPCNYALIIASRPVPPATLTTRGALVTSLLTRPVLSTTRRRQPGRGI